MTLALPALRWLTSPNYSSRGGQRVRLIVWHDCEGSFGGSASWFAQALSRVSANIVLSEDGAQAIQMVAWANKAWHACNFNPFSEGVEAAGYAAKGLGAPEWRALANIVAFRLKANGLPCQVATAANNWTGYCQHVDLGQAGGGHHDVTTDPNVRAAFDQMVREAYVQPMPSAWLPGGSAAPPVAPATFAPSGTTRHDLTEGSLEWTQMHLNALGFAHPLLKVDGLYGPATESAVAAFQRARGLLVDGDPGALTIAALKAAT